jgi:hypothetical protein
MKNSLLVCFLLFFSVLRAYGQAPTFSWAKINLYDNNAEGKAVTVDNDGNVYTTGMFRDTSDFDPGPGSFFLFPQGDYDVFVLKLDSLGNFIWARSFGGSGQDCGNSINIDAQGNIIIAGYFKTSVDFDPGPNNYILSSKGGKDLFCVKLDLNGNLMWAKGFGGISDDIANSIFCDNLSNSYLTGSFVDTVDFDSGVGIYNLFSSSLSDIFILKINSTGDFLWAKQMGGSGQDEGTSICGDLDSNVYATGWFKVSGDFDPGTGTDSLMSYGNKNLFITKLDSGGNLIWAKSNSGGSSQGNDIAVYNMGYVAVTGWFNGNVDFDPNSTNYFLNCNAVSDIFILKLTDQGSFSWAGMFAGGQTPADQGLGIDFDSLGNIYSVGNFENSCDFDPGIGVYNMYCGCTTCPIPTVITDGFISILDPGGNFIWAGQLGGVNTDRANDVFVDKLNNIYSTGRILNGDLDPGSGVYNLGIYGAFILKMLPTLTTGTPTEVIENNIKIFPNPGTGAFNVTWESPYQRINLEISNNLGKIIRSDYLENGVLDMTDLADGLYFIRIIYSNGFSITKKIIKN